MDILKEIAEAFAGPAIAFLMAMYMVNGIMKIIKDGNSLND